VSAATPPSQGSRGPLQRGGISARLGRAGAGLRKYRSLLRYALANRTGWALIVATTFLSSAVGLLQPWPMQVVIDHVLGGQAMPGPLARLANLLPGANSPRGLLLWAVLAGLLFFAAYSAVDVILTRAWIRVGQGMVYRLAGDLFAHIQRRSLLFHSRNPVGDSMSRITGDSWCAYKVTDNFLFTPAQAVVLSAGIVAVMASMDFRLTLLALAVAPLMAGTPFLVSRSLRLAARARREIESRLQSHLQQSLSGIQVVQAFAQEDREQGRFQELTGLALRAQRRSTLVASLCNLASGLAATLGTGAVLWFGSRAVLEGRLSLGELLVFLTYLTALQGHLKALTGAFTTLQEVSASVDRVLEMLEADLEVSDVAGAEGLERASGHVRLEGVTFGYEPGRPVLRGVSLEARPSQTVAVVGLTGAGKTTLVSLVPRFFDPWEGRVTLDGRDVRSLRLRDLRGQVGLVLQEPFLFPLSVAENIAYGRPGASRAEVEAAARAANAHAFIERLPQGYDTVVGQRGATLSGGERQRLSIARALLKDAPVLILDEPTSALDAETEGLLMGALRRLMAGRTTLLIAHRLSTVRAADRIVVLHEGRVAESGTHDELLALGGRYARFHRLQLGQHAAPAGGERS
jgi:ABC-type multidrug transport system fused ATPase/permease subunit